MFRSDVAIPVQTVTRHPKMIFPPRRYLNEPSSHESSRSPNKEESHKSSLVVSPLTLQLASRRFSHEFLSSTLLVPNFQDTERLVANERRGSDSTLLTQPLFPVRLSPKGQFERIHGGVDGPSVSVHVELFSRKSSQDSGTILSFASAPAGFLKRDSILVRNVDNNPLRSNISPSLLTDANY